MWVIYTDLYRVKGHSPNRANRYVSIIIGQNFIVIIVYTMLIILLTVSFYEIVISITPATIIDTPTRRSLSPFSLKNRYPQNTLKIALPLLIEIT